MKFCAECSAELPPVTFGNPHHPMCSARGGPGPMPTNPGTPAALLADLDWEQRVIDIAQERFKDIKQLEHAEIRLKWVADPAFGAVPMLYVIFDPRDLEKPLPKTYEDDRMPGVLHACYAYRLTTASRSTGLSVRMMEGQRLSDFLRRGLEEFLLRHGIVIQEPEPEGQFLKGTVFSKP